MAFKLIESAQDRWRAVNAPHLVALVRAEASFISCKLVERPGKDADQGGGECRRSGSRRATDVPRSWADACPNLSRPSCVGHRDVRLEASWPRSGM
jgi:hypothetical protein